MTSSNKNGKRTEKKTGIRYATIGSGTKAKRIRINTVWLSPKGDWAVVNPIKFSKNTIGYADGFLAQVTVEKRGTGKYNPNIAYPDRIFQLTFDGLLHSYDDPWQVPKYVKDAQLRQLKKIVKSARGAGGLLICPTQAIADLMRWRQPDAGAVQ